MSYHYCIKRKKNCEKEYILVTYSKKAEPITSFLMMMGVNIVNSSGKNVKETVTIDHKTDKN